MKREVWDDVAARLTFPGSQVKLKCDDYLVTLQVHRDGMRMVIAVYVNGWMRGEWLTKDCEERRRFMRPLVIRPKPYTKAQIKLLGRKWCDEQMAKHTHTVHSTYWPSVEPLRRHFEKFNETIELAQEGT